ncbi:MAG: carboxypeptidase-like regulatory domain-containing protein [Anaerolineae bacterium]
MKRLTTVSPVCRYVCVALICMQEYHQRNVFALNSATDTPSGVSPELAPSDSITPTYYFTSYLPIVVSPEALVIGHIADDGRPVANVIISTSIGRSTTTDANGDYQIRLPDGSHTMTPTLAGYTFSPTFRLVTVPPNAPGLILKRLCRRVPLARPFSLITSAMPIAVGVKKTCSVVSPLHQWRIRGILHVNTETHHAAPNVLANTLDNLVVSVDMRQTDNPVYPDQYGV